MGDAVPEALDATLKKVGEKTPSSASSVQEWLGCGLGGSVTDW
jgi:hypothetical protein